MFGALQALRLSTAYRNAPFPCLHPHTPALGGGSPVCKRLHPRGGSTPKPAPAPRDAPGPAPAPRPPPGPRHAPQPAARSAPARRPAARPGPAARPAPAPPAAPHQERAWGTTWRRSGAQRPRRAAPGRIAELPAPGDGGKEGKKEGGSHTGKGGMEKPKGIRARN